jgi:hypothetical protein
MAFLTKKDILSADDLPKEKVTVKEWGGDVMVRGLTAAERDEFEKEVFDEEGNVRGSFRPKLVTICCVDEEGKPLFNKGDDVGLAKKSGKAIQKIFRVAQRLSGMTNKDLEELAKN